MKMVRYLVYILQRDDKNTSVVCSTKPTQTRRNVRTVKTKRSRFCHSAILMGELACMALYPVMLRSGR